MTIYRSRSSTSKQLAPIKNQANSRGKLVQFPSQPAVQKNHRFSLRLKITLIAIAISIIPLSVIGTIVYRISENLLVEQISEAQLTRTQFLAQQFDLFLEARRREAVTMASDRIFTDPNLRSRVTLNQKKAALNTFQEKMGFYENIVYFDLQGKPLFQTKSERTIRDNYRDRPFFQQAISSKQITLEVIHLSSETLELEYAAPVKDAWSNQVIGIICFRIPQSEIDTLFATSLINREEWHSINRDGLFIASGVENFLNQSPADYYPQLEKLHRAGQMVTTILSHPQQNERQLVTYVPIRLAGIDSQLNLGTAIITNTNTAFAELRSLRWLLWGGTIASSLIVAAIAAYLAKGLIRRLGKLSNAIYRLSRGQLDTRIPITRRDELGWLGTQINSMAEQLNIQVARQQQAAKNAELISKMAQARSFRELQLPFNLFLGEVRAILKSDRLIFFQFNTEESGEEMAKSSQIQDNWSGTVIAESIRQGYPRTLGVEFDDLCFAQDYIDKYQRGRIQAITDIYHLNLPKYHLQQLENFGIRASLILPVIVEGQTEDKLIGLLIAHQCSNSRVWQESEVDYLQQVAYQLGMILRGYLFVKEERQQQEILHNDLAQVGEKLSAIATGDLTVSAAAGHSAIKDVADSFNTTVRDLGEMIAQIKDATGQIEGQMIVHRESIAQLKDTFHQQANYLILAFNFIEQIVNALQEVMETTTATSQVLDSTIVQIETEQVNVRTTISNSIRLREIVDTAHHRIKSLEAFSQDMERVVALMGQINLRHSLLTNKRQQLSSAPIDSETAIQKEQELVQQSITATKELQKISLHMANQIATIMRDLELNRAEIHSNKPYRSTDSSLSQMLGTIQNARHLTTAILNNSNTQIKTAQKINRLKLELEANSELMAAFSDRSLQSLQQTAIAVQNLQQALAHFQLNRQ
ncbi:MAG: methyl-accepting chemotaxis protein [Pleurocapsa sp.]